MGIFNLFKKNNTDDQQNITPKVGNNSQELLNKTSQTEVAPIQQKKRDERADLEKLLALDKKLEKNREIREAHQKNMDKNKTKAPKPIHQKPEEIRARQALSIKNPFRGV